MGTVDPVTPPTDEELTAYLQDCLGQMGTDGVEASIAEFAEREALPDPLRARQITRADDSAVP